MSSSAPTTPRRGDQENTTESSLAEDDSPVTPDKGSATVPSPEGKPAPVDRATGHYGPGYGDPTRHQGNDLPPNESPRRSVSGPP